MPTITLKGIPDELYSKLKESAASHRRSINNEAIWCLEKTLTASRPDPDEFLASADAHRRRVSLPPLTEKELRSAKGSGRP